MNKIRRREVLRNSLGLSGALLGGISYEHRALMAQLVDQSEYGKVKEPVEGLQCGKFGQYQLSRLIVGGNLISGSAHAGELIYQSALMTHYFSTEKILETWTLAEQNGINTTLMRADPHIMKHYNLHKCDRGGKLQWIATSAPEQGDPAENAKLARDNGAIAMYLHGSVADGLVKAGKVEEVGELVEGIRKAGILAGVGAHQLDTARATEQAKVNPDFYMVTFNRLNYYSSEASEVGVFMRSIKKPWVAFKVLGAGRVEPQEGFRRAFQAGADFMAVGMFDWQVRDDAALVRDMLAQGIQRERAWA
jgi:hypothetical protein